jgi:hypothetical protein
MASMHPIKTRRPPNMNMYRSSTLSTAVSCAYGWGPGHGNQAKIMSSGGKIRWFFLLTYISLRKTNRQRFDPAHRGRHIMN